MVRKKDSFTVCLDPVSLNKAIKRPNLQFTRIDEIIPELTEALNSVVDARSGFWQVKLTKESAKLTTFSTPFGNTNGFGFLLEYHQV